MILRIYKVRFYQNQKISLFSLVMTDQQRELFQTMDQQQKVSFIQRLKAEREMEMRQKQMQMQAAGGAPSGGPSQPQFQQQQQVCKFLCYLHQYFDLVGVVVGVPSRSFASVAHAVIQALERTEFEDVLGIFDLLIAGNGLERVRSPHYTRGLLWWQTKFLSVELVWSSGFQPDDRWVQCVRI